MAIDKKRCPENPLTYHWDLAKSDILVYDFFLFIKVSRADRYFSSLILWRQYCGWRGISPAQFSLPRKKIRALFDVLDDVFFFIYSRYKFTTAFYAFAISKLKYIARILIKRGPECAQLARKKKQEVKMESCEENMPEMWKGCQDIVSKKLGRRRENSKI